MIWRIDLVPKDPETDFLSLDAKNLLAREGFKISSLTASRVYLIEADISKSVISKLAKDIFLDPILENISIGDASNSLNSDKQSILIFKKPGVMDPVEESTKKAFNDAGHKVSNVRTGIKYSLSGNAPAQICSKILSNLVVDQVFIGERPFKSISIGTPYKFKLVTIPLDKLKNYVSELSLDNAEIGAVKKYFKREATDVELETIAQTWSEHCKHKTFKSKIKYNGKTIQNLFKETIAYATDKTKKPYLVSVFKDNAGIIRFTKDIDLAVKVETHNHPSAIEPYGGSNTGLGGVIRDILGAGLGAKPIAGIDVFAVAKPDCKLMPGTIGPATLLNEVVAGVRDYGNRMGIPTVCGAVYYDNRYLANPLVYCGVVGVLPTGQNKKIISTGDLIFVIGGRTGKDGIHGATFSSAALDEYSQDTSQEAVQIGNAIVEKRILDFIIEARDKKLFTAITDCGAGGLSSAVGEITEDNGAVVHLDKVPLKYAGLSYKEIWISEAQERMVLIVPSTLEKKFVDLANRYDVETTNIGTVSDDKKLVLYYQGNKVCDLDMNFLHNGLPIPEKTATWKKPKLSEPKINEKENYNEELLKILASYNVKSKESIIRCYDHEVQGNSIIKPLCGLSRIGPSDGVVIKSPNGEDKGFAIGLGINPSYADISPYDMAALAIDEAVRNVLACGANPFMISILDNFCWGDVNNPEILGALVEACFACRDIAIEYQTPFISGKDSLNNTYKIKNKQVSIPHTLLITAVGIVDSIEHCVTMDAKCDGEVYILGTTKNELGGSEYYKLFNEIGSNAPKVEPSSAIAIFKKLHEAITKGVVRACHDISEGGLATAIAEMCIASKVGADIDISKIPTGGKLSNWQLLFSETPSRFLVETNSPLTFEKIFSGLPVAKIGRFKRNNRLVIKWNSNEITALDTSSLHKAFRE